MYGQVEF